MNTRRAIVLVGLGYGDEGKGTMTDFICDITDARLVVRYNGGSQAAHNVVTDDGRHHTFAQFGSGSFVPGTRTLLSRFMLWDPLALAIEATELSPKLGMNALDRIIIDRSAPTITPFHIAANRIKEWARGGARHGSCGKGIGETASDVAYRPREVLGAGDVRTPATAVRFLKSIQERRLSELVSMGIDLGAVPESLAPYAKLLRNPDESKLIAEAYRDIGALLRFVDEHEVRRLIAESDTVFEGAQGVLLDEWHGFHPFTTWSTTVPKNALTLIEEAGFDGTVETIGIVRAYGTRHGAGPFVTESDALRDIHPGEHNSAGDWQGAFRFGAFDGVMARYARDCVAGYCPLDGIAITHLDVVARVENVPYCDSYFVDGDEVRNLKPNFCQDLVVQEGLSRLLLKAKPGTGGTFERPEDAVSYIEGTFGTRAKYLSYGPRAANKLVVTSSLV